MSPLKPTADLSELVEAINTLTRGSDPPKKGNGKKDTGGNGKRYMGGGVAGAAAIVLVWVLTFLVNQGTTTAETRRDAQTNTSRITVVEQQQKDMAVLLAETVTNSKVLTAQVESIVDRLERMDRKEDRPH